MNRSPPKRRPEGALNHAAFQHNDAQGNRNPRPRPQLSLDPRQITSSPTKQNIEELRKQISKLTEAIDQKKGFLDTLGVTLSNAYGEKFNDFVDPMTSKSVLEEISQLVRRNASIRQHIKIVAEKEKRLASDWHVINKRNELKAVQQQIAQIKEEIQTLEIVRRRRNQKVREIDSEVTQARCVRIKQREYVSKARVQFKELADKLRQISRGDIKIHDRYARLQEQYKLGITIKDLEDLKQSIQEQEKQIHELLIEEDKCKKNKEMERNEKHKIIAKEQKECKLLEEQVIELQKQLLDKDLELQRSYQFTLK